MRTTPLPCRLAQYAVFLAVMYVSIQVAVYLGVEEKSWWEKSWEFVTGGSVGAVMGLLFFVVFGAIGWVSGPLFGAVGLLGLLAGGALGGMGLGAIVRVLRNPESFNIDVSTVTVIVVLGLALALGASSWVGRVISRRRRSDA